MKGPSSLWSGAVSFTMVPWNQQTPTSPAPMPVSHSFVLPLNSQSEVLWSKGKVKYERRKCPPWRGAFSLWLFPGLASGPHGPPPVAAGSLTHPALYPGVTDYFLMLCRGYMWRGQNMSVSRFLPRRRDWNTSLAELKDSSSKAHIGYVSIGRLHPYGENFVDLMSHLGGGRIMSSPPNAVEARSPSGRHLEDTSDQSVADYEDVIYLGRRQVNGHFEVSRSHSI